jgi:hypothetical protein
VYFPEIIESSGNNHRTTVAVRMQTVASNKMHTVSSTRSAINQNKLCTMHTDNTHTPSLAGADNNQQRNNDLSIRTPILAAQSTSQAR